MKKTIKFVITLFTFTFIFINQYTIKANYQTIETKHQIEMDGIQYSFASQEDLNHFLESRNPRIMMSSGCFPGSPGYPTCNDYSETTRETLVKQEVEREKFIGYHTRYWDNVSSYTLTDSNQLKFGLNFNISNGVNNFSGGVNVSFNSSVGRTYSANSNRRSKLGAFVDLRKKLYRVDVVNSYGSVIRTAYHYTAVEVINKSSKAVYESFR